MSDPRRDLARMLREAGDLDSAIDVLREVFTENLGRGDVATELATMLADQGRFDEASKVFRHALKTGPNDPMLMLNYGTYLGETGRHSEAADALEDARWEIRRCHAVAEDAEEAWELEAMLGHAECMLARVLVDAGRVEQAERMARRWLVHPAAWSMATDVMEDVLDEHGGDLEHQARSLLAEELASPGMVAWLVELELWDQEDPVAALDILVAGDAYLFDGWVEELEDLPELVRQTSIALRRRHLVGRLDRSIEDALRTLGDICGTRLLP